MKTRLSILALLLVLLTPQALFAAAPVAENTTISSTAISDFSFSHTGTGTDLLAVVLVSQRYGADGGIVGVTYGGVAMTKAVSPPDKGMGYVFYLANPATGAQTVAVDMLADADSANRPTIAVAMTLTGANLVSPIDSTAEYSGSTDNSIDDTITTTQNDVLIVDVMGSTTGTNPSPSGTDHTTIQDGTYTGGIYGFGYKVATTSGAHTLGWSTTSQTNDFGLAIAGIAPVAVAGGTNFQPIIWFD